MKVTKSVLSALFALAFASSLAAGEVTELISLNRATGEISEYLSVELPMQNIPAEVMDAFNRGAVIDELTVVVPQVDAEGKPVCYLKYKLDRCFVKSWSTSGDADDRPTEEVAFYYNKIAFSYAKTADGKESESGESADPVITIGSK